MQVQNYESSRREAPPAAGGPEASIQQLTLERQQLTIEMRDKLRFTELQLSGAREESSRLANTVEDQRARLADVEAELADERERQRRQEPAVRELHRSVQAAESEKHAVLEELQQEQWRVERVGAAKEQTIALQEQRLHALQAELRQAREEHSERANSGQSVQARLADQTRVNAELTQQLMLHKEQLRALHSARRSEAQLQAVLQHGQSGPLAGPQLGSCAASGRAWQLWAACAPRGRGQPTGCPAVVSAVRASRLQSRRFGRLFAMPSRCCSSCTSIMRGCSSC
jgi:chromosome segregation ATPase